jgi:hypothetical protein
MVVLVMHVLKIFLMDNVIHNIVPCIWVMVLEVGTFPTSPLASHVRVLSRSALVVIIPCSILITSLLALRIPWFPAPVLFTAARKMMIPSSVFYTLCTCGLCGASATRAHPCLSSPFVMAWCISPPFQLTFVEMSIVSAMMSERLCAIIMDQFTRFPSITSAYTIERLL